MKNFKTIYKTNCAFGGYLYKATSDGINVHLQELSPKSASFKTLATISQKDFDTFAEKNDIYNPYNQDPAALANFIDYILND